jgi:HK97 family phage major capsid protein
MNRRTFEIRAKPGEPLALEGLAVVFDEPADMNGYTERIAPQALDACDLSDVPLLTNHDAGGIPLARSPQTLQLSVTPAGLQMRAELPGTEQARAVHEAVRRGDLSQMSFAFDVAAQEFDDATKTRTITAISKIYEISIVNFAAYPQTKIQARAKGENDMSFDPIAATLEGASTTTDTHAAPEYSSAFFKSLLGKELTDPETRVMTAAKAEKRADAFNTLSNSAAILPEQTLNQIISQARPQGGLFNHVRLFSVPANLAVPVGTPTDPAAWHVEGSNVDRSKVVTHNVTFYAYELLKVLSLSAAAQRMTIAAFESYITRELSASITDAINAAIITGTGSGQPQGLLTGITWGAGNSITAAALTADHLLAAIAMLPAGYAGGAKFAMSNATLFGQVYPLKTTVGDFIFANPESGGVHRLFGFEIVVDDNLPAGVVLFGNFGYYGVNVPAGIAVECSRESGFTSGLIDYRALCIADGKPIIPGAFVKITAGA